MKTNSGKFAMKSVITKPISKLLKKKTRNKLIKDFAQYLCVEVDIEEAFAKIELAFGHLTERYFVIRNETFVSGIFNNKKDAKKLFVRLD